MLLCAVSISLIYKGDFIHMCVFSNNLFLRCGNMGNNTGRCIETVATQSKQMMEKLFKAS